MVVMEKQIIIIQRSSAQFVGKIEEKDIRGLMQRIREAVKSNEFINLSNFMMGKGEVEMRLRASAIDAVLTQDISNIATPPLGIVNPFSRGKPN